VLTERCETWRESGLGLLGIRASKGLDEFESEELRAGGPIDCSICLEDLSLIISYHEAVAGEAMISCDLLEGELP
jgi:hypothetical protein